MPRARDPARDKAREMWEASGRSLKLCEIAERLKVPEATVRAWKSKDRWEAQTSKKNERNAPKKNTERSDGKRNAPKRKPGGQPGNKNGKGAPPGNAYAVTHGAYMQIYGDLLTDEEKALLDILDQQEERDRLRTLYAQHQITERRLMGHINAIENGAEMITHRVISTAEPTGTKGADGREITKVVRLSQEQETRKEQLRNFTDALTRVRAEMRRVADSLRQITETEAKVKALTAGDDEIASLVEAINSAWEEKKDGDD